MLLSLTPTQRAAVVALRAWLLSILPAGQAAFTGYITGTTLTVVAVVRGSLAVGDTVLGAGVLAGTLILAQTSGAPGAVGTYLVSQSQAVAGGATPAIRMSTGVEVVQSQVNRVPEVVSEDFILLTPMRRTRLAMNTDTFADVVFQGSLAPGVLTVSSVTQGLIVPPCTIFGVDVATGTRVLRQLTGATGGAGTYQVVPSQTLSSRKLAAGAEARLQPTEFSVQVDVHGPSSGDFGQVVSTLWRDLQATSYMPADMQPLYVNERGQLPFTNGEQQWETRWVMDLVMQINESVGTPQDAADVLDVVTTNVEQAWPA